MGVVRAKQGGPDDDDRADRRRQYTRVELVARVDARQVARCAGLAAGRPLGHRGLGLVAAGDHVVGLLHPRDRRAAAVVDADVGVVRHATGPEQGHGFVELALADRPLDRLHAVIGVPPRHDDPPVASDRRTRPVGRVAADLDRRAERSTAGARHRPHDALVVPDDRGAAVTLGQHRRQLVRGAEPARRTERRLSETALGDPGVELGRESRVPGEDCAAVARGDEGWIDIGASPEGRLAVCDQRLGGRRCPRTACRRGRSRRRSAPRPHRWRRWRGRCRGSGSASPGERSGAAGRRRPRAAGPNRRC